MEGRRPIGRVALVEPWTLRKVSALKAFMGSQQRSRKDVLRLWRSRVREKHDFKEQTRIAIRKINKMRKQTIWSELKVFIVTRGKASRLRKLCLAHARLGSGLSALHFGSVSIGRSSSNR